MCFFRPLKLFHMLSITLIVPLYKLILSHVTCHSASYHDFMISRKSARSY
uniref:Uncharacterized protein n=1 Tax=Arundo donax TaxID=35708 RepID=A0A0A9A1S0_ARUDO